MTQLLDQALEAARTLPAAAQDDIARIILQLARPDDTAQPDRQLAEFHGFSDHRASRARH